MAIACVGLASSPLLREASMQVTVLPVCELLLIQRTSIDQIRVGIVSFRVVLPWSQIDSQCSLSTRSTRSTPIWALMAA